MNEQITYKAHGYCWGKNWGGGECGYPTERYEASSLEELNKQINEGIKTGSIDSGMGYEDVLGAMMTINRVTEIEYKGRTFTNTENEVIEYGKLSQEALDALDDVMFY